MGFNSGFKGLTTRKEGEEIGAFYGAKIVGRESKGKGKNDLSKSNSCLLCSKQTYINRSKAKFEGINLLASEFYI